MEKELAGFYIMVPPVSGTKHPMSISFFGKDCEEEAKAELVRARYAHPRAYIERAYRLAVPEGQKAMQGFRRGLSNGEVQKLVLG